MADWADQAAHFLVGDVAWSYAARWAAEMPSDVAEALREASRSPLPSGTDKKQWEMTAKKLVRRLDQFMDRDEIDRIRIMIIGGLAAASVHDRDPSQLE